MLTQSPVVSIACATCCRSIRYSAPGVPDFASALAALESNTVSSLHDNSKIWLFQRASASLRCNRVCLRAYLHDVCQALRVQLHRLSCDALWPAAASHRFGCY